MPRKKKQEKKEDLYNYLKKISKRANQRLVRLERNFGANSWASKKLKNKLDIKPVQAWTEAGRIKINKKMTVGQLRATIKATEQFLNSKTSTVKGIKSIIKRTKKSLAKTLEKNNIFDEDEATEEAEKLTDSEADILYDMLAEDYIKDLLPFIRCF